MQDKFKALQALGAGEFAHLHGPLIEHLQQTYALILQWEGSKALADAGLYHAAYGTDGFPDNMLPVEQRQKVAEIIGEQAEEIVYLYCACDRDYVNSRLTPGKPIQFRDRFTGQSFEFSQQQSKDFCELTVANELQLVISSEDFKQKYGAELKDLFLNMLEYLTP